MKTHEIKTEKGEFVAVDLPIEEIFTQDKIINAFIESNNYIQNLLGNTVEYKLICKLSETTEEDASKVVEQYQHCVSKHKNYLYKAGDILYFNNPIESLYSLLKSKGIDINNGNWYLFNKV